jgi:hypothetical protein
VVNDLACRCDCVDGRDSGGIYPERATVGRAMRPLPNRAEELGVMAWRAAPLAIVIGEMEFQCCSGLVEVDPSEFHHVALLRKHAAPLDGALESSSGPGQLGKCPSQIFT